MSRLLIAICGDDHLTPAGVVVVGVCALALLLGLLVTGLVWLVPPRDVER